MMVRKITMGIFHIGFSKLEQHQLRVGDDGGDDDADGDAPNIMFV